MKRNKLYGTALEAIREGIVTGTREFFSVYVKVFQALRSIFIK